MTQQTGNNLWFEWVSPNLSRSGNMMPESSLPNVLKTHNPGYRSLYSFKEEDALAIRESASSRGFAQFEVASDAVAIDLDDGDATLPILEAKLQTLGLGYTVWSSGGKGYHVYIPHGWITSNWLPHSQMLWVEGLGLPHFDPTLYQHGRVISLPGRVHPKTKRRKALVKTVDGAQLNLALQEPPKPKFNFMPGRKDLAAALLQWASIAGSEPAPGKRHTALWSAAETSASAGLSMEVTLQIAYEVNDGWALKKDDEEVKRAVEQAYRLKHA